MLVVSDILHEMHWIVIAAGCVLSVIAVTKSRKQCAVLLALYLAFILYMTLAGERGGETGMELRLFWSYRRFLINEVLRKQILNNIWLFVPVGAMLYRLLPRWYVVLIPPLEVWLYFDTDLCYSITCCNPGERDFSAIINPNKEYYLNWLRG